jgi:purine-cytosine permease-like protein
LTTFQARFIDVERSQLTAKITMIILILFTLLTYGSSALSGNLPWTDLVAVLLAIIMAMTSLSALAGTAAVFGRFYPEAEKYQMFINALNGAKNHDDFEKKIASITSSGDDMEEDDV